MGNALSIPQGHVSYVQDDPFLNQIPTRLVLRLVESVRFNGHHNHNPFFFQRFDPNVLAVYVGGTNVQAKALTHD